MNLDLNIVLEILQVGFPGLVFLLSLFSYRLLASDRLMTNGNNEVFRCIRNFMYINVLLAVLTMSSPIIDHTLSEKSETFTLSLVKSSDDNEIGMASVCIDEKYISQFLLIKDSTSDKLVQVKADKGIPCTGEKQIILNTTDAANLGWLPPVDGAYVEVTTALPGYKFIDY